MIMEAKEKAALGKQVGRLRAATGGLVGVIPSLTGNSTRFGHIQFPEPVSIFSEQALREQ